MSDVFECRSSVMAGLDRDPLSVGIADARYVCFVTVRRGDGLDLNPRLLTQSNSRELELVTAPPDAAWPGRAIFDTPHS
jgi:hypothetical protein